MSDRPRILLFCRTYLPGFLAGGPVRTLANLVEALGDELDFHIVTLDRDFGQAEAYPGIVHDRFVPVGKAQVRYMAPGSVSAAAIDAIIAHVRPDILYLNSIMDRIFPPRVLRSRRSGSGRGIPTILAVRGQFNPGAMAIRRPMKLAYLASLKWRGLLDDLRWQATGEPEAQAIERIIGPRFLRQRSRGIAVAPNLSHAVHDGGHQWQPRAAGEPLRLALLGRISPMKNIDYAIAVLAKVRRPVALTLFGPVEDPAYWATCRAQMTALPPHAEVHHHGPVPPTQITETLAHHDAFFLPTRGENFGHAIAEALSAGLPAIISDRTPWRDLADRGVGAVLPLDEPAAFAQEIDRLADLDAPAMAALHRACSAYAKQALTDSALIDANRSLFRDAISRQHPTKGPQ